MPALSALSSLISRLSLSRPSSLLLFPLSLRTLPSASALSLSLLASLRPRCKMSACIDCATDCATGHVPRERIQCRRPVPVQRGPHRGRHLHGHRLHLRLAVWYRGILWPSRSQAARASPSRTIPLSTLCRAPLPANRFGGPLGIVALHCCSTVGSPLPECANRLGGKYSYSFWNGLWYLLLCLVGSRV